MPWTPRRSGLEVSITVRKLVLARSGTERRSGRKHGFEQIRTLKTEENQHHKNGESGQPSRSEEPPHRPRKGTAESSRPTHRNRGEQISPTNNSREISAIKTGAKGSRKKKTMARIKLKKIVPPAIVLSDSVAKKEPRYIIPEAIEAAYEFPGESIPLANEDLVDKSYAPQILKQARRVDENFNVYFSLQKRGYNNTAFGKSWYYKGIAYLVNGELDGDLPEHTEVVELPKAPAAGAKVAKGPSGPRRPQRLRSGPPQTTSRESPMSSSHPSLPRTSGRSSQSAWGSIETISSSVPARRIRSYWLR